MNDRITSGRYGEVALELLDEHGPADPTLALNASALASYFGVTRSTLYRHWETVTDMNADVGCFVVVLHRGWQRQILEQPVDRPLQAALLASLGDHISEIGLDVRVTATGWRPGSPGRRHIRTWEAAWLEEFAAWIEAHCTVTGRRLVDGATSRSVAVGIVGLIEGLLIWRQLRVGLETDPEHDGDLARRAELAENLLDRVTEPASYAPTELEAARSWTPAPLPTPEWPPGKADLGQRLVDRLASDTNRRSWHPEQPSRIVDTGRLARRLGVSERTIFATWPTTVDMNVDMLYRICDREQVEIDAFTDEALSRAFETEYTSFDAMFTSALGEVVRSGARQDRTNYFGATQAMADPEVARHIVARMDEWRAPTRTIFLAILSIGGRFRRTGMSAAALGDVMLESIIALHRLAAFHPTLLDERITNGEVDHPLCGLVLLHTLSSMSTDEAPSRRAAAGTNPAPPIAPDRT